MGHAGYYTDDISGEPFETRDLEFVTRVAGQLCDPEQVANNYYDLIILCRLLKKLPSIMEFQFFAKLLSLIGFDIALKDGGGMLVVVRCDHFCGVYKIIASKKSLNKVAVSPEALEQEENDGNDDGDRSDESDNSDDDGDGRRRSKKAKVVIVEESLDPDLLRDAETHIQCLALRVWSQGLEQEEEDNEHVAIDTAVCRCIDTVQQLGVYQV